MQTKVEQLLANCPVIIEEGQVCGGWREEEDRIKYGCENCRSRK